MRVARSHVQRESVRVLRRCRAAAESHQGRFAVHAWTWTRATGLTYAQYTLHGRLSSADQHIEALRDTEIATLQVPVVPASDAICIRSDGHVVGFSAPGTNAASEKFQPVPYVRQGGVLEDRCTGLRLHHWHAGAKAPYTASPRLGSTIETKDFEVVGATGSVLIDVAPRL